MLGKGGIEACKRMKKIDYQRGGVTGQSRGKPLSTGPVKFGVGRKK